ncbi:HEAT repeat domain-containing protein [bacterium]|nr:HEAT repeat domain-containing protein [bacterium]
MKSSTVSVVLCVALLIGCLNCRAARACSCVSPPPPLVALGEVDAVFSGTVVARRDASKPRADGMIGSMDPMEYTIAVLEVWKGELADTVAVRTARSSASCGYPFTIGTQYLIYADTRADTGCLRTNLCTRTKPLEHADGDVAELNSLGVTGSAEEVDRPVLELFVAQLYSDNEEDRAAGAEALGTMGLAPDVVVRELSGLYERGTPSDRLAAVRALGWSARRFGGGTEALPVLLAGLKDESDDVRLAALSPFSRLKSVLDMSIPEVTAALHDTTAKVRAHALRVLNSMLVIDGDVTGAAPVVKALLEDQDERVRSQAVQLLPRIAPASEVFEAISPLAEDESSLVRRSVAYQVGDLAVDPEKVECLLVEALADTSHKVRVSAAYELCEFAHGGARAVQALIRAWDDDYWQVRKTSVRALSTMADRSDEALSALVAATEHEAEDVREEALVRLGMAELDTGFVMPIVERGLDDPSPDVRMGAMHALERMAKTATEAIDALIRVLDRDDPQMRRSAVAKLGRVGAESQSARDAVTRMLTDDDPDIQKEAEYALRRMDAGLNPPEVRVVPHSRPPSFNTGE